MTRNFKLIRVSSLLGPAFVAAVAYVDPGNFAANFSAGAKYGYALLWVLVLANLVAGLVQYMSAKVGIVTGMSLPEVVATRLGRKSRLAYWFQAEVVAVACDLAEVIGGAIALNLLFHLPLLIGAIITGLVSLVLLLLYNNRGQKLFERVIFGLLLIIPIGFFVGLTIRPPDAGQVLAGLVPQIGNGDMLLLAAAMIGATVMPHVIYLHSALSRDRHGMATGERLKELLRATKIDVSVAMVIAGSVNIAMLLLAAASLRGQQNTESLSGIFHALSHQLSPLIAVLFGLSLLISGFASTSVGSQAGVVIMDGLLKRRIPLLLRRIITMVPAIIMIGLGLDPTRALIVSQVILSFGIPFALVPLLAATSSKQIMGIHRNRLSIIWVLSAITIIIVALNLALVFITI